ncbi:hypothetical protein D9M71_274330 [compost metagenome]
MLIQRHVHIGVVLTKHRHLLGIQVRIQRGDRLGQRQANYTLDRLIIAGGMTGATGGLMHGFDNAPD